MINLNIVGENATHYLIETRCPSCHQTDRFWVSKAGLDRYNAGAKIQQAWPDLSASRREQMMTGFDDECFRDLFSEEDDGW